MGIYFEIKVGGGSTAGPQLPCLEFRLISYINKGSKSTGSSKIIYKSIIIMSKEAPLASSISHTTDEIQDKKGKKPKAPSVSVFRLFRFATFKERLMICIAIICSAGTGALQPVSILIYGSFISTLTSSLGDTSDLVNTTLPLIHTMVYMGTASLVAAYVSTCLWILTGESQTRRIRSMYLKSVLHQDMSWFDQSKEGSLNTRLASDTQLIQDGISEKAGLLISFFAQFVGGFVVAFVKGNLHQLLPIYIICIKSLLF